MFSDRLWFTGDKYRVKHQVSYTDHAKWLNNQSVEQLKKSWLVWKSMKSKFKITARKLLNYYIKIISLSKLLQNYYYNSKLWYEQYNYLLLDVILRMRLVN